MGLRDRLKNRVHRLTGGSSAVDLPRAARREGLAAPPPSPAAQEHAARRAAADKAAAEKAAADKAAADKAAAEKAAADKAAAEKAAADKAAADKAAADKAAAEKAAAEKAAADKAAADKAAADKAAAEKAAADNTYASDYATTDAPVRNAHHRDSFETTAAAMAVAVHDADTGRWLEFSCEPGEYVLDAADRAGLELPYSCRSGGCLSCAARIVEGAAEMGEQYVLEDEHLAQGFFLLCCTSVTAPSRFLGNQEDAIQ